MVKREKANYMIQSVAHALDVLEALSKSQGEVGVTELSKRLKLHKNNVFRLLATLELRAYVEQNPATENYRLGVQVLRLGQSYITQSSLVARAKPILEALTEKTGETSSFVQLHNGEVNFPVCVEANKPVKVTARVATALPAKQSAPGRLLIAQLQDSALEEILATNTPHDVAIRSKIPMLRSEGVYIDRQGEIESDVTNISAVVRAGKENQVVGAIEVIAPHYRAKVEEIRAAVEEAARALSDSLGAGQAPLAASIEKEVTQTVQSAAAGAQRM